MIKTITITGDEVEVVIGGQYCNIRNDGTDTIYASTTPGISAGADGVISIPAGGAVVLPDVRGKVYLLGTGSAALVGKDDGNPVFKPAAATGGGEDTVARTKISAHEGNTEVHVTAAEKAAWNELSKAEANATKSD